ncbi:MAG: Rpn family recombination-promoting nuclease/putative transposase [Chloroflexaceae bacterium]|nr:Rpn family recombination-promoting nuclease/putative transposase [Chloroflexaceae bacterium]
MRGKRIAIYVVVEHRSTCEPRMPWRALLYAGEEWDRFVREHPRRRRLPFILPLLLTQHPARTLQPSSRRSSMFHLGFVGCSGHHSRW